MGCCRSIKGDGDGLPPRTFVDLEMFFSPLVVILVGLCQAAKNVKYIGSGNAWTYDMQSKTEVEIHKSCNASESIMLQKGLSEMKLLAQISKVVFA